jgi:hypothetical protein
MIGRVEAITKGHKMKAIGLFLLFAVFATAAAQDSKVNSWVNDPSRTDLQVLQKTGSIISLRIVRKSPLEIYVLGNREGTLDLNNLNLTIRRLSPKPEKALQNTWSDDHFIITEPLSKTQSTKLEIITHIKGKSETFHIDLPK